MRQSSESSYRIRINKAVEFVQAHLDEALEVDALANAANMSRFHFHRIFLAMTGLTPTEYVEYARMNAVVNALRDSTESVTGIATSVGYGSGGALAKVMRRRYGLAPGELRRHPQKHEVGVHLDIRAFSRAREYSRLTPRIADVPEQIGLFATEEGLENNQACAAYARAVARVRREVDRLDLQARITSSVVIVPDAPKGPNDPTFRTVAGYVVPDRPTPPSEASGVRLELFGGGRHAIFRHAGPRSTLWQSWFAIHHDWLPASGMRLRRQHPFHVAGLALDDPAQNSRNHFAAEIFIPIE